MANIYFAAPPGPDQNSFWAGPEPAAWASTLSCRWSATPTTCRSSRPSIAGNELPDMLQTPNGSPPPIPNLPQLLDKRFTNLTEHLSGDAVKDYPNLANIPTRTWKSTVFNGGIYGIPIPRGAIGSYHFIRQDLFEAAGVSPEPKSVRGVGRDHQGADRPEEAPLGLRPVQPAPPAAGPDERRAQHLAGGGRQAHPRLRDRAVRADHRPT